jgi:ElaB/YqjD/DUF883 family membrane-anchored ribosome-binding protein
MVPQNPDVLTPTSRAGEMAKEARDTAKNVYEQGKRRVQEWGDDMESYVRDQPFKSVLIAAGVGLALGFLLGRR